MFDPEDMILNDKNNKRNKGYWPQEEQIKVESEMKEEQETVEPEMIEEGSIAESVAEENQVEEDEMDSDECCCGKTQNGEGPPLREYRYEEQVKKTPRKTELGKIYCRMLDCM